jgi:hypothetical protein
MKTKRFFLAFSVYAFLVSCEYAYPYRYSVTNTSDTIISVHIKTYRIDSVCEIKRDEERIIYTTDHGIEGSKGPYFQDVSEDLYILTVRKGVLNSKRDFLSNSSWLFEDGTYSATFTNADF